MKPVKIWNNLLERKEGRKKKKRKEKRKKERKGPKILLKKIERIQQALCPLLYYGFLCIGSSMGTAQALFLAGWGLRQRDTLD